MACSFHSLLLHAPLGVKTWFPHLLFVGKPRMGLTRPKLPQTSRLALCLGLLNHPNLPMLEHCVTLAFVIFSNVLAESGPNHTREEVCVWNSRDSILFDAHIDWGEEKAATPWLSLHLPYPKLQLFGRRGIILFKLLCGKILSPVKAVIIKPSEILKAVPKQEGQCFFVISFISCLMTMEKEMVFIVSQQWGLP